MKRSCSLVAAANKLLAGLHCTDSFICLVSCLWKDWKSDKGHAKVETLLLKSKCFAHCPCAIYIIEGAMLSQAAHLKSIADTVLPFNARLSKFEGGFVWQLIIVLSKKFPADHTQHWLAGQKLGSAMPY